MSQEHKVKAVLDIGGSISHTLHGAFNAVTGNIGKIGEAAQKSIKGTLGKAITDAKADVTKLNAELKKTGADTVKIGAALELAKTRLGSAKGANELYYSMGSAASKFAVGLATVTAEATAAGWAMYHLTEKYEDYLKTTRIGALKNDLTPQNYARLNYATGGIKDPEKMEAVMKARALFDKAHMAGTKQYLASLKAIGLTQKDLAGMTLTDAFFKVGDSLKNYKGGDRLAIAKNLMGRGGTEALPFLMRGSKDNRERMAEADKLGISPTAEDIEKSKEYDRVMIRMTGSILGVKLALGQALLPAMERLGTVMSDFMVKHHDEFAQWANRIGTAIEHNMPTMEQLEGIAHKIGRAFEFAENHTTLVKVALGALITLPFLPFIGALGTTGIALKELGGAALIRGIGSVVAGLWGMGSAAVAANVALLPIIGTVAVLTGGLVALGSIISQVSKNWDTFSSGDAWKGMAKNVMGLNPVGKVTQAEINAHRKIQPVITGQGRNTKITYPPIAPRPTGVGTAPTAAPSAPVQQGGGTHAGATNHVMINVHPSPGMDERGLAQLVASHLDRALTGGGALYDGHFA